MLHFNLKPANGDEKPKRPPAYSFRPEASNNKLGLERLGVDTQAAIARVERNESARIEGDKEKSLQFNLR